MMVDPEKKRFWIDNTKPLDWDCPRCGGKGLTQFRGDDKGHAVCPDCLTVYAPSWDVVHVLDEVPVDD